MFSRCLGMASYAMLFHSRCRSHNPLRNMDMKQSYNGRKIPPDGQPIEYVDGKFVIPDRPIIPFIEGDGTGRDIWKASRRVFDSAVAQAYGGKRKIAWF